MTTKIFDSFQDDVDRGNIVPSVDIFKRMLISAAGVAAIDAGLATKRSDVIAYEITGSGYTAGGMTCAATLNKNTSAHRNEISFAATVWTSSTISAGGSIVYKSRGGAASADELVYMNDFGSTISSSAANFTAAADVLRRQNP